MNNKKILTGILMICLSTFIMSCASSKKVGCYYGSDETKEHPTEEIIPNSIYTVAE